MRARNIKPGFFKNEDLAELGPYAQLLFEGLWCLADREGRLEDRPKRIKAEVFPYYDPKPEIKTLFGQLAKSGFILQYSVNENNYIEIINFTKHQTPHVRESVSTIPEPVQGIAKVVPGHGLGNGETSPRSPDSLNPDSLNPDSGVVGASPPKDNGDARPALLPVFSCIFFEISRALFDEFLKDYPALTPKILDLEFKKLRDYCESNPRKYARTAKGRLKAPGSVIRNWLGRVDVRPDQGGDGEPAWKKEFLQNS